MKRLYYKCAGRSLERKSGFALLLLREAIMARAIEEQRRPRLCDMDGRAQWNGALWIAGQKHTGSKVRAMLRRIKPLL